ncbi:MAG: hypothetical protein K6G91_01270 [Kiritimatiellae bacterium]|nr:hypothetical protein [Kiritimatiellia bacterium]
MEEEIAEEEGRNPAKEKRTKPEKTPEDLAAIAYLDRLRSGEGETMPMNLPLACVVKVVAYEEVPKANDRYALATLLGPAGRTWKMCINRYYLEKGMRALFVSGDAAMPNTDRFRNRDVAKVKLRVFRFGFGVKETRLLPIVSRNIYYYNCGLLYPLDEFPELKGVRTGTVCAERLGIEKVYELRRLAAMPKPKKGSVFVPGRS